MIELILECVDCRVRATVTPKSDFWSSRQLHDCGGNRYGYEGNFHDELHTLHAPKGWSVWSGQSVRCPTCHDRLTEELCVKRAEENARLKAERQARYEKAIVRKKTLVPALKSIFDRLSCTDWQTAREEMRELLVVLETKREGA